MSLFLTMYSYFFMVTAMVSFFVAWLAWSRRLVSGALELAFLMIAAGFGAFSLIFETAAPTISEKIFWAKLEFIGGIATPVLYLIFVLRFTGKEKYLTTKYFILLFIIPAITLLLTLTNESHNLIWSGFSAISEKTNLIEYYHGLAFWVGYIGYTYIMLLLAMLFLINFILLQNKPFRTQGWVILIGGICPWIASIIYLTGNNPVPGLDISPVSIILSGVLSAYAIFNFRFLDLVPVARETLVETLPDGIVALDGKNRIQDINGAAIAFLGISNKKIIGFDTQSAGATEIQLLDAIIDQESESQIEIESGKEIKTFRIIKQNIKNQHGSRLVVIRDISDRVARQKEIKDAEERYRNMYSVFRLMADNTEDFLWAKDINNRYTFVNKTMCDRLLIAKNIHEPIGKADIFFASRERAAHPENQEWHTFGEICADTDTITLQKREPMQFDEFGNIQGKFLFLDVHKAPIWDENGYITGVVGTARDVTHTKKLEEEKSIALESLKKSEENLQRINAEKDKFFSIIAHDLRGPFSGFLGLTQMMAEELPSLNTGEIKEIAVSLSNSSITLYRLLENLLNWARIQQGTFPFNPEVIQLHPCVTESINLNLELSKNKGIDIVNAIPDDLTVFSDINILQTILRNLISNAVKFTPKGGKVSLSAKEAEDNFIEIAVNDNGIGMNLTLIENLFRLDVHTNREGTEGELSTGLGLILCKEFIEKLGGRIWVESEVGIGSRFYFTLQKSIK